MIKRVFFLFLVAGWAALLLLALLRLPAVAGDEAPVLLDAVLYDGYENGDADEAVRLRNVRGMAVDIGGWQLNDGESGTAVIPPGTFLAPGQTLWLAKNGAAFGRQFGFLPDFETTDTLPAVPNLAGVWPGLSNGGDQVMLLDDEGALVDCLAYEGDADAECGSAWAGPAVQPYRPTTSFGAEGQILYRQRDQRTGRLLPDTDRAADWAQGTEDVINGRKVLYPGWDLDAFFRTTRLTETAVLTIAVAPDNAYEAILAQINNAQATIRIETQTFENMALAEALLAALERGVAVTVLMEAEPAGGIADQERYICQQLEAAGGECWFMFNEGSLDIYDRYTYLHAKFILIDQQRVIISSENLSPRSLPSDDKSDGTWGRRGVVLITDAPGVVAHVQTVFDQDWAPQTHLDITRTHVIGPPPPDFVPITQTGGTTYTVQHATAVAVHGSFAFEVVQSPENSLRDVDGLLGMVGQAGAGDVVLVQQLQERPYWGASSSNPQADPNPRLEAYIAAARRGAAVRLMLDAYFDTGNAVSNTAACAYVNEIAEMETLDLFCKLANPAGLGIHNKMVLVQANGRGFIHVGSLNGSELSSKGNRELALQVQSDEAHAYLAGLFWQDWGYAIYMPAMPNGYRFPANHVLISELLYDPPGAQDDAEFIELVNPTNHPLNLSGFALGDAVNPSDFEDVRRFPAGTFIAAGQTLVVATTGTAFQTEYGAYPDFEILDTTPDVPDMIDDLNWGDPNTFLRLGNSGDEIILRDPFDGIVDMLVYGAEPAANASACALVSQPGYSLERFPYWLDTDACAADFREWPFPNPGLLP